MTSDLSNINSSPAQQAALESISSRLALINELISYSNDLDHLLAILQARFSGTPATERCRDGYREPDQYGRERDQQLQRAGWAGDG